MLNQEHPGSVQPFREGHSLRFIPCMVFAVGLMIGMFSCATNAPSRQGPSTGLHSEALGSLRLRGIRNETLVLSRFLGERVLLINFWATFCQPCKEKMRFLQRLHSRYGPSGLTVLNISLDPPETRSWIEPFVMREKFTFQVCIDEDDQATQHLNPNRILPLLLLFDQNGQLRYRQDQQMEGTMAELENQVKGALNARGDRHD